MSEKDDIMGLSLLVGSHIKDLKQKTTGNSKFISGGLEDPREFVQKMARQDITPAVQQARLDLMKRIKERGGDVPTEPATASQSTPPQAPQAQGVSIDPSIFNRTNELIQHTNIMLQDVAITMNSILELMQTFIGEAQTADLGESDRSSEVADNVE